MKKRIVSIAIGTAALIMGLSAFEAQASNAGAMQVYAVEEQSANLGTTAPKPAPKPKTTKPKSTKKKTTSKKTTPQKTTTKKPTTKKPTTKKPSAPNLSTTAEDISPASLNPVADPAADQTDAPILQDKPAVQSDPDQDGDSGLPQADPAPKSKTPMGLAIAGLAGISGLGLVYMLKKFFWH